MKTAMQQERQECLSQEGILFQQGATPSSLNSITQNSDNLHRNPADGKQTEKEVPSQKPKREHFTQIPNCVIESELSETSIMGFIRFFRHFGRAGVFTGSLRKLCKALNMARTTVARIIGEWVKAGWMIKTTRPKADEEGEIMCLILLEEALWKQNRERYRGVPENDQGVPNLDSPVPENDRPGPTMHTTGPTTDSTVPPATLKTGGNMKGNRESNTESNMDGNRGSASSQRITEPLPVLPSLPHMTIEEITSETPHTPEAILAIGAHYLGDKVSRQDAEAFVRKTQSTATLVGAHEVRRQLVRTITFMFYSDAPANWYRDKPNQVTLRSVTTHYDDYTRKAQKAAWQPPLDTLPAWYSASERPSQQDDYFAGMSEAEAASLTLRIQADYPGIRITWGNLPGGRCTVGLWMGEEGQWCDLWKPDEWERRDGDQRLQAALEAYAAGVA